MSILLNMLKIKEYHGKAAVHMLGGSYEAKTVLSKNIDDGKCYVYGIDIFGKIVGRVCLSTELKDKSLADGKTVCYLSHLYVNSRFRGRGIGSKLVNHVIDNAKKMGFSYITLGVDETIDKNVNLYKRLGFNTLVGQWKNSSNKETGNNCIVLKKDLMEE